jgi:two-component system cell cycle response regulator
MSRTRPDTRAKLSVGASVLRFARAKVVRRERAVPAPQWLDGLIVGSAIAAVLATLALAPIEAASTTGSTFATATNLAYLILLVLVVTAAACTGWRPGRPPARQGTRLALVPAGAALVAVCLQFAAELTPIPVLAEILTLFTLLCVVARMALSLGENQQRPQASISDSLTDALTGLANRRRLMADLETAARSVPSDDGLRLFVLFDLDGFKAYNDAFGHPAGDALLIRLGRRLESFASPRGRAYRLGGDEFCLLVETTAAEVDALVIGAAATLSEQGDGFRVISSLGNVLLPSEASGAEAALQLADQRLYANKSSSRSSAGSHDRDVPVMALNERQPEPHAPLTDVAGYAARVAAELRMDAEQRDEVVRAAQLRDSGKMAIPDALLKKPGPLDEEEWDFMRRHTVIGERIIAAAPALGPVAQLVRSSHERWDGSGYPDGLAGKEIPLGSRIVAVCDAYEAMIADRPYGEQRSAEEAMAELGRCAGTQFDPAVVAAFLAVAKADLSPGHVDAGDPPPSVSVPPGRSSRSG